MVEVEKFYKVDFATNPDLNDIMISLCISIGLWCLQKGFYQQQLFFRPPKIL